MDAKWWVWCYLLLIWSRIHNEITFKVFDLDGIEKLNFAYIA